MIGPVSLGSLPNAISRYLLTLVNDRVGRLSSSWNQQNRCVPVGIFFQAVWTGDV